MEQGAPLLVYQTEHKLNELSPVFKEFSLNLGKLAGGDVHAPVIAELWDWDESGHHTYMGEFTFSVESLVSQKMQEFKVLNPKNRSGASLGSFYSDLSKLELRPSFLDYVRGGTQLALIGAIDFTGSNGDPSSPRYWR